MAREAPPNPISPAEGSGRILVVEDNQVNAMILCAMLRRDGWEPLAAADGFEGIEMMARFRPRLILMDLQMPKLDGFEAARRILEANEERGEPAPVIIAVTAAPGSTARATCLEAGFADLIAKPVEMAELLALVRRFMK